MWRVIFLQDLCDAKAVMFNICSLLASRLAFATTFLIDDFVDEIAVCFTLNILQSHCFFFCCAPFILDLLCVACWIP